GELDMRRGYRCLQVNYRPYADDLSEVGEAFGLPRKELLRGLRGYFDRQNLTADWDAINDMDDLTLLTSLCMMCPFTASEKQALLEAESQLDRARVLATLLRFGQHENDIEGDDPRPS
ncbi:MAG TPA: peptidase, partial [Acidisoma sp.]|nr:peptidase [Acidisoma sp.]